MYFVDLKMGTVSGCIFFTFKNLYRNANGENYEKWYDKTKELVGEYIDHHPTPTCLRNHAFIQKVMAGGGPIHMVTKKHFKTRI